MFERYTEKARRVIFFAHYEASLFGSPYIETEHLLLGLLREDRALTNLCLRSHASVESIRKQIEAHTTIREKVSTLVDLPLSHGRPLSHECKRVLAYAAEEAERLSHKHIGHEHLLLGLLREEKCFAANLLCALNISLDQVREWVAKKQAEQESRQSHHAAPPHRAIQTPIAIAILTEDKERLAILQQAVEDTKVGRNVFAHVGFPTSQTNAQITRESAGPLETLLISSQSVCNDPLLRQIEEQKAGVVLIDIDPQTAERAIRAIEIIHANTNEIAIFAVGPLIRPETIVSAMRAGAREYLERNATSEAILGAFLRLTASHRTRKSLDPGPGGMWTQ
jgi:Clp amino terminal domain, pathogenicity island component